MSTDEATLLEAAIALAVAAHAGARDKAGHPYILHPLTVMQQMDTPAEMMTAVLHDVVEDTPISAADLAERGFPGVVLEAVALLTHDRREKSYLTYINDIKQNPLARKVKLADLRHNMDLSRIPEPTKKDYRRLKQYHQAWVILANA